MNSRITFVLCGAALLMSTKVSAESQGMADRVEALFAQETEILNGLDTLDRRIVKI